MMMFNVEEQNILAVLHAETSGVEMVDVNLEMLTSEIKETVGDVKVEYKGIADGYTKMVVKDNDD